MSKTNLICVGGPMHGKRKQVEEGRRWFEVVEHPTLLAAPAMVEAPEAEIAYRRHLYEREVIGAGDKSITFWRHSEMPVGQVVYYLLNDLSDNAPHVRAATLEWALKQVKEVAIKADPRSRDTMVDIIRLVNRALRPSPTQLVDE